MFYVIFPSWAFQIYKLYDKSIFGKRNEVNRTMDIMAILDLEPLLFMHPRYTKINMSERVNFM